MEESLQMNFPWKHFCFICSRQNICANRPFHACTIPLPLRFVKLSVQLPGIQDVPLFNPIFSGRIDLSLYGNGGRGEQIKRDLWSNFWELGVPSKLWLFIVLAQMGGCPAIYTLLAVDLDPPRFSWFFPGQSNWWFACFEHKSWENTTKAVGLACVWLHNDSIYLARSQWIEQSRVCLEARGLLVQAPHWFEQLISPLRVSEPFVLLDHHVRLHLSPSLRFLPFFPVLSSWRWVLLR